MSAGAPGLALPITGEDEVAWAGLRRQALILDRTIGIMAEVLGAGIVVAETCILFAGVVSRYVFNSPLMWTDELANFLFLWLAMLGTVVALRRDEHMRLTTFVNSLAPQWARSRSADLGAGTRAPASQMVRTFVIAVPGLTLPFVIRAAVIQGVATATEVSTVGVIYTALLGLIVYRQFDWRRIYPMLVDTASLTGAVMLIIGTATAMAWALTQSGFSQWLVSVMAGVPGGTVGFLAITIVAFIVLGSVLEGLPAIVLFGPLLFPVAKAMGVHEVHYAMIVILAMGIGLFAPPFGVGYYGACAIGRVSPDDALWRIWPYIGALVVALAIVAAIPWISIGFL